MDLVLGRFADAQIAGWSEAELDDYERLLEIPDQPFFAWVSGAEPVPAEYDTPMFRRLRAFNNSGEGTAGELSRRIAARGRAADARPGGGRRRRPGAGRSRARDRRQERCAGHLALRRLPRRPAHGAIGAGARLLRPRHLDHGIPGLGLPALRPGVAQRLRGGAAHDRAVALGARDGPRPAVGVAHHHQRCIATRAGARIRRHPCAVGRARQRHRHAEHRRLAGAQRLCARLHRARAGRLCRARRHSRSLSARHGHAGAARFLRRRAGDDPQLRPGNATERDRAARARPGAGGGIPARHRDHPPLSHRLCGAIRRRRARRSPLRSGERRAALSGHGALAAAVPWQDWKRCSTICPARRWRSNISTKTPRASAWRKLPIITRRAGRHWPKA